MSRSSTIGFSGAISRSSAMGSFMPGFSATILSSDSLPKFSTTKSSLLESFDTIFGFSGTQSYAIGSSTTIPSISDFFQSTLPLFAPSTLSALSTSTIFLFIVILRQYN